MNDMLAAALAFDRAMRARAAQRTITLSCGLVVLHDELPMLHHLNALLLDAPLAPEVDAVALADNHLHARDHRHIVFDDADAAELLAPSLLDDGWKRDRVVFMEWRGDRDRPPAPGEPARELSAIESESLEVEILTGEAPGGGSVAAALVRQLIAGQLAVRAGTPSQTFGACVGGAPVSSATVFTGAGIAIIDEVATVREHRERGFARAAIVAALSAAIGSGAEQIVVPADADDWPQLIYAKLGFEPIGRQVAFTRTLGS